MPQQPNFRVYQFGLRGWAAIALGLVILGALTILALGFFVLLLPVLLLAPVIYYFLPRPKIRAATYERPQDATIIDGEFRVVGAHEIEQKPGAND